MIFHLGQFGQLSWLFTDKLINLCRCILQRIFHNNKVQKSAMTAKSHAKTQEICCEIFGKILRQQMK